MSEKHHSANESDQLDDNPRTDFDRYARQTRFAPFGIEGQEKLASSCAVVVGCGALGSVIANTLTRAGAGHIKLIDRDYLELNNLQRQVLYDEQDVADGLPKAIAAARKLGRINGQVTIEPHVIDIDYKNVWQLTQAADVIVDGTDNFETRFLINDVSLEANIPWVYGGCVGSEGQTMTILPGKTPCLRCLMIDGPPPPGTTPTCDSAGILGAVVNVVASIQANEAIKILSGHVDQINRKLTIIDLWSNRSHQMSIEGLADKVNCPCCRQHQRQWLSGQRSSASAVLCGRNAVSIRPDTVQQLDLEKLERRLRESGKTERNEYLLRYYLDEFQVTVFPDGRAIIVGTDDIAKAKSIFAQWIGG